MSSLSDLAVLVETTQFAAVAHRNQRRKDEAATPYINHPVGESNFTNHIVTVISLSIVFQYLCDNDLCIFT
eukprot:m.16366 g.16366  ORF g.16366 m.16366 type:complete len:71 (-) comp4606_c1_seq2:31-243(-)